MDAAWVFAHTIVALDTVADPDWAIFYIAKWHWVRRQLAIDAKMVS